MAKALDHNISSKIWRYLGKQTQTKTITEISRSLDIGRNINEILRGLSVIQTIELMPCNRKLGEAVLKGYS